MKITRHYKHVLAGARVLEEVRGADRKRPMPSVAITIALEGTNLDYSVKWSHPPTPRMLDEYYDWRGSVVSDWETATGIKLMFDDGPSASYKAGSPGSQTTPGAD